MEVELSADDFLFSRNNRIANPTLNATAVFIERKDFLIAYFICSTELREIEVLLGSSSVDTRLNCRNMYL